MTYTITIADVGIISRVGRTIEGNGLLIKFQGAKVSMLQLNGKRYLPDKGGAYLVSVSDLGTKNSGTAYAVDEVGEEREIILEEFGYVARESKIKPLWNREIVAGFATMGALIEQIGALKERVLKLEKAIEPADNDLCI